MAVSPRIVTEDRWITWDGVSQRLPKGQVLDVPPDSALERAIGRQYLVPLGAVTPPAPEAAPREVPAPREAAPVQAPAPKEEPQTAPPPKPAPVKAKAQDADAKDGES